MVSGMIRGVVAADADRKMIRIVTRMTTMKMDSPQETVAV
jgi:hypothetical protein